MWILVLIALLVGGPFGLHQIDQPDPLGHRPSKASDGGAPAQDAAPHGLVSQPDPLSSVGGSKS